PFCHGALPCAVDLYRSVCSVPFRFVMYRAPLWSVLSVVSPLWLNGFPVGTLQVNPPSRDLERIGLAGEDTYRLPSGPTVIDGSPPFPFWTVATGRLVAGAVTVNGTDTDCPPASIFRV